MTTVNLLGLGTVEIVSICVAGAGAILLVLIYWRHQRRRRQAAERLQAFKEQVVAYSDAMDGIKERHKMLPFTDLDFKAPMIGETLAAYEEVEVALQRHNDIWLKMMDVWDKAQKLLEEEGISKGNSADVEALLESTDVASRIAELKQECETELNRLEQAHERVDALLAENQQSLGAAQEGIEQVGKAGLATAPYDDTLAAVSTRTAEGIRLREADPLNAELELQQAKHKLGLLRERVEGVLQQQARSTAVAAAREQAAEIASRRRAEGLRFEEPQGNPDPMLREALECHAAAVQVLTQGDYDGAKRHLDNAEGLIDQAVEAIEFLTAFRETGGDRIRQFQADVRQLIATTDNARQWHQELQDRHAPESWRLVDNNADQASALADAMENLLDEAVLAADDNRQDYYRAQELLDEVAAQLPEAQELAAAVRTRLDELNELADASARRAGDVDAEARRLENVLHTNTADRSRSNHRFELASQALTLALQETQRPRPNWIEVDRQIRLVEKDLGAVNEMVGEDLRLAQQAVAEIREASQELRRCQGFYQMGISPNVGHADGELRAAERAEQRQDYEEAIRLANSAEQAARDALARAQQEAEKREREAQQRRNRESALQMASVLATAAAQAAATFAATRRHRRRF